MRPPRGLWDTKEVLKSSLFKKKNQNSLCLKSPKIRHFNFFTLRVFLQIWWQGVGGAGKQGSASTLNLRGAGGSRSDPLGFRNRPSRVCCVQSR